MSSNIAAPAAANIAAFQLYLTDLQLFTHFESIGAPLPFGVTRLRQDRRDGRLGGVPFRQIGGKSFYNPDEVSRFLTGLPIIQSKPPKATRRTGRPDAAELAESARRNMSIPELRAQRALQLGGV